MSMTRNGAADSDDERPKGEQHKVDKQREQDAEATRERDNASRKEAAQRAAYNLEAQIEKDKEAKEERRRRELEAQTTHGSARKKSVPAQHGRALEAFEGEREPQNTIGERFTHGRLPSENVRDEALERFASGTGKTLERAQPGQDVRGTVAWKYERGPETTVLVDNGKSLTAVTMRAEDARIVQYGERVQGRIPDHGRDPRLSRVQSRGQERSRSITR